MLKTFWFYIKSHQIFLRFWLKKDTSTYKYKLATLCLYKGIIYRTIGFNSSLNSEIKYDDLYAHWSKLDTKYIDSIESKVFKVKKYLSYKLKDNEYAIYIAPFIGMKQNEEEVVFPLNLRSKDDIKVKSKFLNDEEYTIKKLNELNNIFDIPKCRCLESLIIEMNYNFRKNKSC